MPTIGNLTFPRVWTNPDDFPTYVGSEVTVREDMQCLYDVIQTFINGTLVPTINAILEESYSPGSVDTAAIQDAAVTLAKLASDSVDATKLAAGSVTTSKLADIAVTTAKLALLCVGTAQLADYAVTALKLADGSVGNAKLGADIVPESVGFVVGTGDPMTDPTLISEGQVYLKLES